MEIQKLKGLLFNKEGKWFVKYLKENKLWGQKGTGIYVELPLHPDDVFKLLSIGKLHGGGHMLENEEVEFEIVELKENKEYFQSDLIFNKNYAKLIQPKEECIFKVDTPYNNLACPVHDYKKFEPKIYLEEEKQEETTTWDDIKKDFENKTWSSNDEDVKFIFNWLKEHYDVPTKKK